MCRELGHASHAGTSAVDIVTTCYLLGIHVLAWRGKASQWALPHGLWILLLNGAYSSLQLPNFRNLCTALFLPHHRELRAGQQGLPVRCGHKFARRTGHTSTDGVCLFFFLPLVGSSATAALSMAWPVAWALLKCPNTGFEGSRMDEIERRAHSRALMCLNIADRLEKSCNQRDASRKLLQQTSRSARLPDLRYVYTHMYIVCMYVYIYISIYIYIYIYILRPKSRALPPRRRRTHCPGAPHESSQLFTLRKLTGTGTHSSSSSNVTTKHLTSN